MIRYIRQSEIKEWKICRRAHNLSYHRNLEPVGNSGGVADVGSLVHTALQSYYRNEPIPEWDELNPDAELARIMTEGYFEWVEEEGVDVGLRYEGVELPLEVSMGLIHGDEVVLTGRLDLLAYDEALDESLIIDHKTVQSLDQSADMLPQNEQLLTYIWLARQCGIDVRGAIHNSLRRVKRTAKAVPPFYGRRRITPNEQQLDNHVLHLRGTLSEMVRVAQQLEQPHDIAIEHLLTPPNPNDRQCSWRCPFFHVCPMMDDGSDWEGYLSNFYQPKVVDLAP